ncbi:MAG: ribonuclease E inhibitor RraB [Clostridia bacterium]|nr:ribonuclease E inhibitor RraB [Clostridia bacterium]
MSLLDSIFKNSYASLGTVQQNFCEYTEVFGKQPVFIRCDLGFMDTLPNNALSCCLKIQMDVYVRPELPTLISESEASYIATVRSSIAEHISGRFVGQGVIGSSGTAFLMFYIPERSALSSKKMLSEVFMGSFRNVETTVVSDPDGLQYKKYLYPNEVQMKKSENMKILKSLKTYGDDGTIPRPIRFNIVFASKKDAMSCYSESTEKSFIYKDMVSEPVPEGMVLPRFRLVLERTLPFNIELLAAVDSYLLKLAKEHNGEYKSLETDIVE